MKLKRGAVIAGLKLEMRKVLIAADEEFKRYGVEAVVTSGLDGCHSAGSYHPYGYAVDLRTRHVTEIVAKEIYDRLNARLPDPYDVVLESNHIHIEFDCAKAGLI
jgi:hypothetical protein